ncbi:hypothetical protein [Burkholderia seminalis]|uniref:hypothetical protein n=1 Tax=Burkholderia seminalis TaxID=488731 RepID=UPI000A6A8A96|nr:hypothetical protein [Burkholderia seminalis]MCA8041555.1 hypothetical protein [Burkholderia seminalis]
MPAITIPTTVESTPTSFTPAFPIPFNFGPERHAPLMSRAERRRMEREARKVVKKRNR